MSTPGQLTMAQRAMLAQAFSDPSGIVLAPGGYRRAGPDASRFYRTTRILSGRGLMCRYGDRSYKVTEAGRAALAAALAVVPRRKFVPDDNVPDIRSLAPVPDYPGYFASREGRIYSTLRCDRFSKKDGELHEVSGGVATNGYRMVRIRHPVHGQTSRTVHSLIADTFLGPRPVDHQEIRHLDGNKLNCSDVNLAWGTRSDNQLDSHAHGTRAHQKLSASQVVRIRTGAERGADLARELGVSKALITSIRKGRAWAHLNRHGETQ